MTAFPGGKKVLGDTDTMSATMKPAKELHKLGVGQPTAVCQLMVVPSRRQLVTLFRPAQGGAEDTEERVLAYGMVSPDDVFPRQAAESNALLFSLVQPLAGYMVKSMRLLPGLRKSRIAATAAAPT